MRHARFATAVFAVFAAFPSLAAITGTVMTKEGQPVAGASVSIHGFETTDARGARLLSSSPEPVPIASVQTDAKGNFALESPADPVVTLRIFARGYEPVLRSVERDEDAGAIALSTSEMKSGSVTAGGKPVSGATVAIFYGAFDYVTRTNEQGRYEAPDFKRADRIAVLHPDYAPDESFIGGTPSAAELNRKLVAGSHLNGRVVGLDGQSAVADATITVDGWPLATSGEDGTFTIAHVPQKWTSLVAQKESLIGERSFSKEATTTIRMQRAAKISGRVVDSLRGGPVAGVSVRATQFRFAGAPTTPVTVTDAKGRFELVVAPNTYTLLATHPGYSMERTEAPVTAGQQLAQDLAVAPLARISGIVVDEARRPIAVASVAAEGQDSRPGRVMMMPARSEVATGPDGRFTIRLAGDEQIRLTATKKGMPSASSDPLRPAAGERKTNVVIAIPSGIAVTGRVTDRDERPLSGVTVTATKAESGPRGMMQRVFIGGAPDGDDDAVRTASDGTFTLRLEEGTYHFAFRREGYAQGVVSAQTVSAAAQNVVDATLEPAVEIRGRVVRGAEGVEGVRLSSFVGGPHASVVTGPDGSFTLGGLSPGEIRVLVSKPDDFIQEMRMLNAPAADVVIDVPAGGRITGRVVDKETRRPIANFRAGVSPSRSGGGMIMISNPQQRQFTADDGSFTLENAPSGATTLVVSAPGYTDSRTNLDVVAGKTIADVEVELDPGVRLTGKVTGPNGAALSGVTVAVASPSGGMPMPPGMGRRATTNADGEYTIEALEPGVQQIDFSHSKYLGTKKDVTLKGREARLDAQLTSGQRVTGIVVTEAGTPVADARVTAFASGGASGSARTNAGGTFELDALAPARYRFTASKSGFADGVVDDVDVSGGAPIRIMLSTGGTIYGRVTGLSPRELTEVTVEARAGRSMSSAALDASGNYRIEGAPTGTVQVSASLMSRTFTGRRTSGMQTVELDGGGARQVDLEFRSDTTVTGHVSRNGTPLSGASVSFSPRVGGQTSVSVTTDAQGRYSASGLEDGEYNVVVVDVQRLSPYTTTYDVRGSRTFDINFKASSLRGRVIDAATSEPIADARVQLRGTNEDMFRGGRTAVSDANGTFLIDYVPSGAYVVTASRDGFGNEVRELTIGDSGMSSLELKLARNDGATLKVVDGRDGRALNASVFVYDMQGRLVFERGFFFGGSGDAGDLRLPLAPGTYTASVTSMGYAMRTVTFSAPSTQSVALTPGGTLLLQSKHSMPRHVRLIDANGMPYPRYGTRPPVTTLLPSPGTTTLEHLAPGTYTVQLLGENQMVVDTVTVVVREGEAVTASI